MVGGGSGGGGGEWGWWWVEIKPPLLDAQSLRAHYISNEKC